MIVVAISTATLLLHVLDIVEVFEDLVRGKDLNIELLIDVELERSDSLQLLLSFIVLFDHFTLGLLLLVLAASLSIRRHRHSLLKFFLFLLPVSPEVLVAHIKNVSRPFLSAGHPGHLTLGSARSKHV